MKRSSLNHCLVALAVLATATGCKKAHIIGYSSKVLDISIGSDEKDLGIKSTYDAYSDAEKNKMLNLTPANAGLQLADDRDYENKIATKMSDITDGSALIVFGYGKKEAAQVSASIIKCKDLPGLPGTMPWPENEYCLEPTDFGATEQLAFLSCGSLQGERTSCDSVTEIFRMLGKTFIVDKKSKGASLTETDSGQVDTDFSLMDVASGGGGGITAINGKSGTITFETQAGSTKFDGHMYNFEGKYDNTSSLSLADGDDAPPDTKFSAMVGNKGGGTEIVGLNGFSGEEAGDPAADAAVQIPSAGDSGGDAAGGGLNLRARKRGRISPRDGGDPGVAALRLSDGGGVVGSGAPGYNAKLVLRKH